jgi:hypothetical protein
MTGRKSDATTAQSHAQHTLSETAGTAKSSASSAAVGGGNVSGISKADLSGSELTAEDCAYARREFARLVPGGRGAEGVEKDARRSCPTRNLPRPATRR